MKTISMGISGNTRNGMTHALKRYGRTALALAGLLLSTSHYASAIDAKVYPGTMCVEARTGAEYDTSRQGDGIVNLSSTFSASVFCPVVRDHTDEGWERVVVWVDDQNPYYDISCAFLALIGSSGDVIYSQTEQSAGTGLQALTFQGGSCGGFGSGCIGDPAQTSYQLRCVIPPLLSETTTPSTAPLEGVVQRGTTASEVAGEFGTTAVRNPPEDFGQFEVGLPSRLIVYQVDEK